MKLFNKISLVTGAGKGIGRSIAVTLAKEGSCVVVNDVNLDDANAVAEEIINGGSKAISVKADISQSNEVQRMVENTIKNYGKIDILVNSAGIQTVTPFLELSEEEWQRVIDVNLKGTFLCSQMVAKEMVKHGKGKIINITSIHQSIPRFNKIHYDVSKAGIAMLTKDMALELSKYKINVNSVAPGAIMTPMNEDILASSEKMAEIESKIPWKRMGKPEEVAQAVLYFASDESDYVTGSTINVDGGSSLGRI